MARWKVIMIIGRIIKAVIIAAIVAVIVALIVIVIGYAVVIATRLQLCFFKILCWGI